MSCLKAVMPMVLLISLFMVACEEMTEVDYEEPMDIAQGEPSGDGLPALQSEVNAEALPTFGSLDELIDFFGEDIDIENATPDSRGYVVGPYAPCSNQGKSKHVTIGGRTYRIKVLWAKIVNYGWGDITNTRFVETVADGESITQTYSFTLSRTIGMSFTDKWIIKDFANYSITNSYSWTVSHTWSRGTTWSFPSKCAGYDAASFYAGMWADRIEFQMEYTPHEVDEEGLNRCLDSCEGISDIPFLYKRCINRCHNRFPMVLKCNESYFKNGYLILPRPIHWSVCHNI
ncbi:MAG: hypothetical protein QNJ97_23770 [Myxococcota bacterium]|nr:hypothetical protein [Myxococcota bacterium]